MRGLVWFRSDLRLDDNPALAEACARSDQGVVAVYVITQEQWQEHDWAPVKVEFVRRTLEELSAALSAMNIALRVLTVPRFQGVPGEIVKLAKDSGCDALFFNEEYEVNEADRDEAVKERFESEVGEVYAFTDQCVFKPGTIRTGEGRYYTVFSPFKRAWYKAYERDTEAVNPIAKPRKLAAMIGEPDAIPDVIRLYEAVPVHADRWIPGEKEAHRRLKAFVNDRIDAYKEERDFPAIDATSVLSPYLACGAISLRRCVYEAVRWNDGKLEKGSPGAVHWISELVWREFYKHILVGFPRVSMHRAFNLSSERLRWNESEAHLRAWQEGRTGVPIVDAAMRQLVQTGWMHNRLRMVTAMFLTKNLFIDWRLGERFFMRNLLDGDLAANNGGWQWSASTGTDAAPYFRIMNPYSQSKKFDPDGEFIRAYVPELADLDAKDIHDPSQLPPLARAKLDYSDPIIDVSQSRQRAIDAFKALK
ncbi:MAG: deoxyribodipyrimidine photo-lyase [Phycisphaerales bacterium]|nr:deoxyribodipyrimidine photo-lyase [Phycisphaerales bacterium]MCB9837534.1 deoxyribodipyrimidine photo-lyase [Phycisphaera sp.]